MKTTVRNYAGISVRFGQVWLYVLSINKVTISLPDINVGENIRLCSPIVYKGGFV